MSHSIDTQTSVTTFCGVSANLSDCKLIRGVYYIKNVDIIRVNKRWHKKENVVYDYELKIHVLKTQSGHLDFGVVSVLENGDYETGFFTKNFYTNCKVVVNSKSEQISCIDYNILKPPFFFESISEGIFYKCSAVTVNHKHMLMTKYIGVDGCGKPYNIIDNVADYEKASLLYANSILPLDKDILRASFNIQGITFGAELEAVSGTLPSHYCNKYGVVICKDGSLKRHGLYPPEYVTVPLTGAKGMQTLRNVSREIGKRSSFDETCSLHLHIGGISFDRLFILSLYKLCCKIQKDVFHMFPLYKEDEIKFANKEKNYCKKLPNIIQHYDKGNFNTYVNSSYEDIFMFTTGGEPFTVSCNKHNKSNRWGNHKWNILSRYYWVNFTNLMFGKQDTIEFRLHTPTFNSDKILNWLLMCISIMKFAQSNVALCLSNTPITFKTVLMQMYNEKKTSYNNSLCNNLISYYNQRVLLFEQHRKSGDAMSSSEITTDQSFKYNVLNIT